MADAEILRHALRIIGGMQKLVSLPEGVPFLACETDVSAGGHEIVHAN